MNQRPRFNRPRLALYFIGAVVLAVAAGAIRIWWSGPRADPGIQTDEVVDRPRADVDLLTDEPVEKPRTDLDLPTDEAVEVVEEPRPDLNILSDEVLEALMLRSDELPAGYRLIQETNMMARLRMRANPDYVGAPSELEAVARFGGQGSFVAIYGVDDQVRLLLNGIYFRAAEDCDRFIEFQREKDRLVHGFRQQADVGIWLLLAARAPDLEYPTQEIQDLDHGLTRYANRLGLATCMEPEVEPNAEADPED